MINTIFKKITPFLSEYIPEDIAEKAISKISPKIGSFLKQGVSQGLPLAAGMSFLRRQFMESSKPHLDRTSRPDEQAAQVEQGQSENFGNLLKGGAQLAGSAALAGAGGSAIEMGSEALRSAFNQSETEQNQSPEKEPSQIPEQDNTNILEKYDPSLYQYIKSLIGNGSTPMEAALKAQKYLSPKALETIKKMEKDYKMSWLDIVKSVFGEGVIQPETQKPQEGKGQQALTAIVKKLQQTRGKV